MVKFFMTKLLRPRNTPAQHARVKKFSSCKRPVCPAISYKFRRLAEFFNPLRNGNLDNGGTNMTGFESSS
jgi:hypothetical protein